MKRNTEKLIIRQAGEVRKRHSHLLLKRTADDALVIEGQLGFTVPFESLTIEDDYQIRIRFPPKYPREPPIVFEVGCKIPRKFQHFMSDGSLCLGAPEDVRMRFDKHHNLLHFIEVQVVPYLFSVSYFREYGEMPFGELQHGGLGLLQFYAEYFETELWPTLLLLKYLVDGKPISRACPCGSGIKIDYCHGLKLNTLRLHLSEGFAAEFDRIVTFLRKIRVPSPTDRVRMKASGRRTRSRTRSKR